MMPGKRNGISFTGSSDLGRRGTDTAPRSQSQTLEKGLRAMTIKELLEVHRQIEAENERKMKEWKEGKKHEQKGA